MPKAFTATSPSGAGLAHHVDAVAGLQSGLEHCQVINALPSSLHSSRLAEIPSRHQQVAYNTLLRSLEFISSFLGISLTVPCT